MSIIGNVQRSQDRAEEDTFGSKYSRSKGGKSDSINCPSDHVLSIFAILYAMTRDPKNISDMEVLRTRIKSLIRMH